MKCIVVNAMLIYGVNSDNKYKLFIKIKIDNNIYSFKKNNYYIN